MFLQNSAKMRRFLQKLGIGVLAAAACLCPGVKAYAAGGVGSLCPEGMYLVDYGDNHHIRVMDGSGRKVREFTAYADVDPILVHKDAVVLSYNSGKDYALSLATGKILASHEVLDESPWTLWQMKAAGCYYLEVNKTDGQFTLMNSRGERLYHYDGLSQQPEESVSGLLLQTASGVIAGCRAENGCFAVWVDADSHEAKELPADLIDAMFADWTETIGDYVILSGWDGDVRYREVFDLDGHLMLEDGRMTAQELRTTYDELRSYSNDTARYILTDDGDGTMSVYDADLHFRGRIPSPEGRGISITCYQGMLPGLAYDQLAGFVCGGGVPVYGQVYGLTGLSVMAPWAEGDGEYLVYMENQLYRIPADTGREKLVVISPDFYVLQETSGEQRVYRLDSHEPFPDKDTVFPAWCTLSLPVGGVFAEWKEEDPENEYAYRPTLRYELYDMEGQKTAFDRTGSLWARLRENGYIQMSRGIYRGYVDMEANWIVRWLDHYIQE